MGEVKHACRKDTKYPLKIGIRKEKLTPDHILFFDNAGGVHQEHQSRIFEYGYSTKTGTQNGFGLYLCRQILRLYNGDLEYQDVTIDGCKGAGFVMIFPK